MPDMPVFLANVLEPRFARPASVIAVYDLGPTIRRVSFEGPALRHRDFSPGQEIEFRVSERAFRHYTPATYDPEAGVMEVVFHLHGQGPGSRWAAELCLGVKVNVLGPSGGLGLQRAREHVFLGDETTLGLFTALGRGAQGSPLGAVELGDDALESPSRLDLALASVRRAGERGDALLRWLEESRLRPHADDAHFYLAGHALTIVRLRSLLLRRGWSRRSISTKTYWADGKRGL